MTGLHAPTSPITPDRQPESDSTSRSAPRPVPSDVPIIITIDGPAGTGKSTVARLLAQRLGIDFLDTGAMYRAATAIALDQGLRDEIERGEYGTLIERVLDADLHFDWQTDPPAMLAWLKPLNDRIRQADVTGFVSTIAAIGPLRKHMVQKQRIIGHQHPRLVTEGRDQGSIAFPDAEVKFYLDADPGIRAHRRAEQLRGMGRSVDENALRAQIAERDLRDSTRSDGPLICPEDAEVLDTSSLCIDEVLDRMEEVVRARFAGRLDG